MSVATIERAGPAAVTAGFLNTDWSPRDVPDGTVTRNVVLRTADNAAVTGSLYVRGKPDTVVCVMHPREFMACHYLIPDIVESGCAAWSQGSRSVGNDLRLEHELALLDVAAGLNFLRDQGFQADHSARQFGWREPLRLLCPAIIARWQPPSRTHARRSSGRSREPGDAASRWLRLCRAAPGAGHVVDGVHRSIGD